MKGMKDNKIEKERNLVLKHVTLYSVYCRDDTEKAERKREKRERLCVILWKARTTIEEAACACRPLSNTQANGDSVHSTGLPDCSLGTGCTHWMD
jgi:hypothetical protein